MHGYRLNLHHSTPWRLGVETYHLPWQRTGPALWTFPWRKGLGLPVIEDGGWMLLSCISSLLSPENDLLSLLVQIFSSLALLPYTQELDLPLTEPLCFGAWVPDTCSWMPCWCSSLWSSFDHLGLGLDIHLFFSSLDKSQVSWTELETASLYFLPVPSLVVTGPRTPILGVHPRITDPSQYLLLSSHPEDSLQPLASDLACSTLLSHTWALAENREKPSALSSYWSCFLCPRVGVSSLFKKGIPR